jgi:hypothetical protein
MDSRHTRTFMHWRTFVLTSAMLAVLAGLLGYWVGASRHGAFETVGIAHFTQAQIGLESDDWTYNIPLDVRWTDTNGVWYEGGRPECLPPSDTPLEDNTPLEGIRVTAVPVDARGLGFRQVVAVHCD